MVQQIMPQLYTHILQGKLGLSDISIIEIGQVAANDSKHFTGNA